MHLIIRGNFFYIYSIGIVWHLLPTLGHGQILYSVFMSIFDDGTTAERFCRFNDRIYALFSSPTSSLVEIDQSNGQF